MANTNFSGPVTSTNGFVGGITGDVTGDVTATDVTVSGVLDAQGTANIFVVPTSDPGVAGALWLDGATLSVSAG